METQREMEQELDWIEAQKIGLSLDLVAAAKQQLRFLAAVDRNGWLYEAPALEKAIYRYNACWLPLLAKHSESPIFNGPLVVPLDCEWIWHCHRLNPVRYKSDCEELFGRILDCCNVVSSTNKVCGSQTQKVWNALYPDEPYDFNLEMPSSEADTNKLSGLEKSTKYDLASAVKRQSPFFYQVSRPHMKNDIFLEEAVARYKGFLHLIKRNKEKSVRQFCVPTYDIDLIWHTHQLHPVCYSKDLMEALGKILEHDDMDSDRSKGKKLDVGFSATVKQWERTFGTRYRKAGCMYRGAAPSPLTAIPVVPNMSSKEILASDDWKKSVEVFVGGKNLPDGHKEMFFGHFSGCGSGCGGGCGSVLESGGCGSGCGSGCGNMVKSGGSCGSGCGSGCGNMVKSGGSCGSGCGNAVTGGGGSCGGGCGGGCGGCGGDLAETTNASACGACGGGCGGRSTNNISVVEA